MKSGQFHPRTSTRLYWRIEKVEKWSAAKRASAGLAGLIQANATTQMAAYRLTIPVNTMLTEYQDIPIKIILTEFWDKSTI